ncbi:MAG: TM2 domain-containing protein [Lachnospira sp.]|nr:TM2 domain-containing protein [Lachnospira sp.]
MENEMSKGKSVADDSRIDVNGLIRAEEELSQLKREYGIEEKLPFWKKCINFYINMKEKRKPVQISKKKYCLTALFGGLFGIHQFLVGRKAMGVIYLLLSVTGLSFAMSVLDIWYAAFLETDDRKLITL